MTYLGHTIIHRNLCKERLDSVPVAVSFVRPFILGQARSIDFNGTLINAAGG